MKTVMNHSQDGGLLKMIRRTVVLAVVFSFVFTTNADARSSQNTQDANTEVQETIMGIRV